MPDFVVNPALLKWARERAGLSIDQIAGKSLPAARIKDWEEGKSYPSLNQAEHLANKLKVPVLLFLLDKAPDSSLPIPDLRNVNSRPKRISLNFREVIDDCLVRQDWIREEVNARRQSAPILRERFSVSDSPDKVANYLKKTLKVQDNLRTECGSWKEFLSALTDQAEAAGVMVSRSGVVGHDGRRKLNVDEFRGFALGDEVAPLIFINAQDSIAAQSFTLIHEIAHICIGESGISNLDTRKSSAQITGQVEAFCNQVAAEVLVPKDKLIRSWQSRLTITENLARITKFFRVSKLVALRRSHDLGKIDDKTFFIEVKKEYERFRERGKKEDEKAKGGNFWNSFRVRLGGKFTDAIVNAIAQGRVSHTDAAKMLSVRTPTVQSLVSGQGGNP